MVKTSATQIVDGSVDHFGVKNFAGLLGNCLADVMIVDSKAWNVACVARDDS